MQIEPFPGCQPLDGYHCVTSSLAKVFAYHGCPVSEEMLLGLGAGMGFIYWRMKHPGSDDDVFIGGRGNNKGFFADLGARTGIKMTIRLTSSPAKAETSLLEVLARQEPVMVFVDMGFLPYLGMPDGYHFGGHSVTIGGFDGGQTVLIGDIEPKATGLKKGFYAPLSLEQLRRARGSAHKPFPPNNACVEFDFAAHRTPTADDIYAAIGQAADAQLNPPIKNIGIKGMRLAAGEILKWPEYFAEPELRANLFNLYIFIEIGGTGGGCFRYMYSRFLAEAAALTGNRELLAVAEKLHRSGRLFSEIGGRFGDDALLHGREEVSSLTEKIAVSARQLLEIADLEEEAFEALRRLA